jgi:hypothetical protein
MGFIQVLTIVVEISTSAFDIVVEVGKVLTTRSLRMTQ